MQNMTFFFLKFCQLKKKLYSCTEIDNGNQNIMDAILQFFMNKWPYLTIALVAVVGIVWVAVLITKRVVRSNFLEEKCKNMPCEDHTMKIGTHENAIDRMDKSLERVESTVQEIKVSVVALQTFLQSKYKTAVPIFSQKHSPRSLNAKGKEVFAQFGGEEFMNANEEMLCQRIKGKNPRTALDVEQYALSVLYETMELDIFNEVKLRVYNSDDITVEKDGKEEKYSITMDDICFIFSLDLRDRYLKAHPEVPQEEETSEE